MEELSAQVEHVRVERHPERLANHQRQNKRHGRSGWNISPETRRSAHPFRRNLWQCAHWNWPHGTLVCHDIYFSLGFARLLQDMINLVKRNPVAGPLLPPEAQWINFPVGFDVGGQIFCSEL
jgi:hypothetical protein